MDLLEQKNPKTREKRLDTISAFLGDVSNLIEDIEKHDVKQRIRTFSQSYYDEILTVFQALSGIKDAVIIVHGPVGCAASGLHYSQIGRNSRFYVTNLKERDSIMGGDSKLRHAILASYNRYKPSAIFIVSTPVVAINNDEITAITRELEGELNIDIIPISSDGFKSRTAINGYDLVFHAIARYTRNKKVAASQEKYINLISLSENKDDLKELINLLKSIGLNLNIFPQFSNIDNFSIALKADFTAAINSNEGNYFGQLLEESYNIPFLKTKPPVGFQRTADWLNIISEATGTNDEASKVISEFKVILKNTFNEKILSDKKVYINLPASVAISVSTLVEELGGEVVGITTPNIDDLGKDDLLYLKNSRNNFKLHVADGQPFEEGNILNRIKPDLYIGNLGKNIWAARQGIPVVSLNSTGIYGFNGITKFAHVVSKALKNKSLVNHFSENKRLPYVYTWFNKSPNWYIKQEVK